MMFCPSIGGVSHSPAEDTAEKDLRTAIAAFGRLALARPRLSRQPHATGRRRPCSRSRRRLASEPRRRDFVRFRWLHTHTHPPRARRRAAAAGLLAALLALAAVLAPPGPTAAEPASAAKKANGCEPWPAGLGPSGGPAPQRFTMLIRINQQANVDTYSNFDPATGGSAATSASRTSSSSTPATRRRPRVASQLATNLRAAFPCNRIIALNGMKPQSRRARAMPSRSLDHPSVWALMTDFEPTTGTAAAPPTPAARRGPTSTRSPSRGSSSGTAAGGHARRRPGASAGKRTAWCRSTTATGTTGEIAQDLDKKNRRLGPRHLGPLSVQTQDSCANGGASAFGARAAALFDQYKFRTIKKVGKARGRRRRSRCGARSSRRPGRCSATSRSRSLSATRPTRAAGDGDHQDLGQDRRGLRPRRRSSAAAARSSSSPPTTRCACSSSSPRSPRCAPARPRRTAADQAEAQE